MTINQIRKILYLTKKLVRLNKKITEDLQTFPDFLTPWRPFSNSRVQGLIPLISHVNVELNFSRTCCRVNEVNRPKEQLRNGPSGRHESFVQPKTVLCSKTPGRWEHSVKCNSDKVDSLVFFSRTSRSRAPANFLQT